MALLFMEGFGGQDWAYKWDVGSTSYTTSTSGGRTPGGCYGTTANGGILYKTIPVSSQVFTGCGYYIGFTMEVAFYGDNGATLHITVCRNTTSGLIEIRRGNSVGPLLATGTTPILASHWYYLETSCTISDTVGEVHVRLNGNTVDEVSFTGDTKNGGTNTTIDRIHFYPGSGATRIISDLYILNSAGSAPNNNFLGDVTVRTLSPSGNGTYTQLTGSDGNQVDNYLLVDEKPFSGTDYTGSPTIGNKDTYVLPDLPVGVTTVHGVQVNGLMAKSDATAAQARFIVRSGGTDYGGTTRTLSTSYLGYQELHETNPATGLLWTPSEVNSLESGMEVM